MDDEAMADYMAEMRRLLYVAMTRAMSDLVLVYPPADPPFLLPPELDEKARLEGLFRESGVSWQRFLGSLGLPNRIGITKFMTLREAREKARSRQE